MIVKPNFIYPEIKDDHYTFGGGQISGTVLRENGDWRDFLPPYELQRKRNVESSACYVEAQQHAIATIQEVQGLPDQNYSARFNVIYSGGTPNGGDPLKAGQSFRDNGLIPDSMLPFSEIIESWEDFASFKGGDKELCDIAGKQWRKKNDPRYDIVFTKDEPVEIKYKKLREALKYSPVPISVYAWVDKNGEQYKPQGVRDNHLTLCVFVDDENRPYWLDTYEPFIKVGEPFYNSEFAMRWTVKKNEVVKRSFIQFIKDICFSVINLLRF